MGIGSLLPPTGSRAWRQAPLPAEPARQSALMAILRWTSWH